MPVSAGAAVLHAPRITAKSPVYVTSHSRNQKYVYRSGFVDRNQERYAASHEYQHQR